MKADFKISIFKSREPEIGNNKIQASKKYWVDYNKIKVKNSYLIKIPIKAIRKTHIDEFKSTIAICMEWLCSKKIVSTL